VKCFRDNWATLGPKGTTFVSGRWLSPPRLDTHLLALEIILSGSRGVGKQPVRVAMNIVGFARGRTEVTILSAARVASSSDLAALAAMTGQVAAILEAKLARS
jgi:hypothetical protein